MLEKIDLIKQEALALLDKLGLPGAALEIKGEGEGFQIDVRGENLGILIGFHGETLLAFQAILTLLVARKSEGWLHLRVDVEDYRAERETKLRELATRTAERVRFLDTPVTLAPMPAFERRLVHMVAAEIPGVVSESTGEGWQRRVVIKPEHGQEDGT